MTQPFSDTGTFKLCLQTYLLEEFIHASTILPCCHLVNVSTYDSTISDTVNLYIFLASD